MSGVEFVVFGESAELWFVVPPLAHPEKRVGVLTAESSHVLIDLPRPAAGMPRGLLNGVSHVKLESRIVIARDCRF